MEIIEYKNEYSESVKDLLLELQEFIASIDEERLNIVTPEFREVYFKDMIDNVNNNEGIIYVAKEDNKIVGFIAGVLVEYDDIDKYGYVIHKRGEVIELMVTNNVQSKGIGSKLLEKIEEYFKSIGCLYIQIDVFGYNKNAIKFYDKHGYDSRLITVVKKI